MERRLRNVTSNSPIHVELLTGFYRCIIYALTTALCLEMKPPCMMYIISQWLYTVCFSTWGGVVISWRVLGFRIPASMPVTTVHSSLWIVRRSFSWWAFIELLQSRYGPDLLSLQLSFSNCYLNKPFLCITYLAVVYYFPYIGGDYSTAEVTNPLIHLCHFHPIQEQVTV